MKTLFASILVVLVVTFASVRATAHADGVCTAGSPTFTGRLAGNGVGVLLQTSPVVYVTAVCITMNGTTTTLVPNTSLAEIGPAGCYYWGKGSHFAFVAQGYHWTPSCPSFRLTLRTAKAVG